MFLYVCDCKNENNRRHFFTKNLFYMAINVKNGFNKLSESALLTEATFINAQVKGNDNFPDQQKGVDNNIRLTDTYRTDLEAAKNRNPEAIAKKNASKQALIEGLRIVGAGVAAAAQGDLVKLKSSGYPLPKTRSASPALTAPVAPKALTGINAGEIILKGKKQPGSRGVVYSITSNPETGNWSAFGSNLSKFTFTGLTSGVRYYMKYSLTGVRNQSVTSTVVSYIAQ